MKELLARVRATLASPCAQIHEELVATDAMGFADALLQWQVLENSGLTALIVTALDELDVDGQPWPNRMAKYETTRAAEVLAQRARADASAAIEGALTSLGEMAGRDPMRVLHRISPDDLAALERDISGLTVKFGEDPLDLDFDDLPMPDDIREAHAQELVARSELLAQARAAGFPALVGSVRCYDRATALAELTPTARNPEVRVVVAGLAPPMMLLALGFGGFNDCPTPAEHARVWEHFGRAWGARPVVIGADRIDGVVESPVQEREELVRAVAAVAAYDIDAQADGWLALAGRIYRNHAMGVWWD
jgi:hypothetical protein